MTFDEWAQRHPAAAAELTQVTAMSGAVQEDAGTDEAWAQQNVRFQVPKAGGLVWRNNVGATPAMLQSHCPKCHFHFEVPQRIIRYGLANDSHQLNEIIKSADLIGIMPRLITDQMVGSTIGQFMAVECKHPGWSYSGKGREGAQQAFLALVASKGGIAQFSTGEIYL